MQSIQPFVDHNYNKFIEFIEKNNIRINTDIYYKNNSKDLIKLEQKILDIISTKELNIDNSKEFGLIEFIDDKIIIDNYKSYSYIFNLEGVDPFSEIRLINKFNLDCLLFNTNKNNMNNRHTYNLEEYSSKCYIALNEFETIKFNDKINIIVLEQDFTHYNSQIKNLNYGFLCMLCLFNDYFNRPIKIKKVSFHIYNSSILNIDEQVNIRSFLYLEDYKCLLLVY